MQSTIYIVSSASADGKKKTMKERKMHYCDYTKKNLWLKWLMMISGSVSTSPSSVFPPLIPSDDNNAALCQVWVISAKSSGITDDVIDFLPFTLGKVKRRKRKSQKKKKIICSLKKTLIFKIKRSNSSLWLLFCYIAHKTVNIVTTWHWGACISFWDFHLGDVRASKPLSFSFKSTLGSWGVPAPKKGGDKSWHKSWDLHQVSSIYAAVKKLSQ